MRDDFHVGLDEFHVDTVLLLPDDDRPPQFAILALLLSTVCWDCVVDFTGTTPIGSIGV